MRRIRIKQKAHLHKELLFLYFQQMAEGEVSREGAMNLKDALLCIDCDDVFIAVDACNPRCPSCGSSIFVPLSCWVQTLAAFEKLHNAPRYGASDVYQKPIAA